MSHCCSTIVGLFHTLLSACEDLYQKGLIKWRRDSHGFSGTFDEPEAKVTGALEDENGVEKIKTITIFRFRRINGRLLTRRYIWTYDRPLSTLKPAA